MMEITTRLKTSPPNSDISFQQPATVNLTPGPVDQVIANPIDQLLHKAQILRKNGDNNLALVLLRKATAINSNHPAVLTTMAEILVAEGKRAEAIKIRSVLKSKHPSFPTFFAYAQELYLSETSDEEALKAYFECLSVIEGSEPELFEIYKNMGNISVKLRDFDAAEEYYNKAYTINSHSDTLLVNFGTLEVQRNDWDKAVYCFRQAVTINPKNDKGWVGLALMHNEYGDQALAWANLMMAMEINPLNRTAVLLYARWALRDKQEPSAVAVVQNYLTHDNFDEELSLILIHLYCCVNAFNKAHMEVTKMLAWNPQLSTAKEIQKHIAQLQAAAQEMA
jgi:tetratricopeptide (TPR) repeat protein